MTHNSIDQINKYGGKTMKANPVIIKLFAERKKCWMCKHQFEQPVLLPVKSPERNKFQPNINTKALFHLKDTHGLPPEIVAGWIKGACYNQKLVMNGAENFVVSEL